MPYGASPAFFETEASYLPAQTVIEQTSSSIKQREWGNHESLITDPPNPVYTAMRHAYETSGGISLEEDQKNGGISLAHYRTGDRVVVELLAEDKKTSWVLLLQKQLENISTVTMLGVTANYVPPPEWAIAGYAIKLEKGYYEVCQPEKPIPVPVTGKLGTIQTHEGDQHEAISSPKKDTIFLTQGNVNQPGSCKYGRLDLGDLRPKQYPALNFNAELFNNLRNSAVVGVFASKQR